MRGDPGLHELVVRPWQVITTEISMRGADFGASVWSELGPTSHLVQTVGSVTVQSPTATPLSSKC